MNFQEHSRRANALLGTGAMVAALAAAVALAGPAGADTVAQFDKNLRVLTVTGDAGDNTITVSRDVAGHIAVNGGAVRIRGVRATVANVHRIVIDGGAGNDVLALDETNGPLPFADLFGGTGNDELVGGSGADHLVGGSGNDSLFGHAGDDSLDGGAGADALIGGPGTDREFGRAGDDQSVWNPGDGSDTVLGQDGFDTLVFNGAAINEKFTISPSGPDVRFFRDIGSIAMDLVGVEQIDTNPLGGADTVTVNDLTGTDVVDVNVDEAATVGGQTGDGAGDSVTVNGTSGADRVSVTGAQPGGLTVAGLHATVRVNATDGNTDALTVNGLDGNDTIDATGLGAGVVSLALNGGAGDDVLLGGAGNVVITQ